MIIVICGPTASGKSALALKIAEKFGGEIINGDAFQVYKEFNIGTAKPSLAMRAKVPHHLFDFLEPTDRYSPYQYQQDGRRIIQEIESRKAMPIIVGGSGNYQKALLFDYTFEEYEEPDLSRYDQMTNEELYRILLEIDEETAHHLHPNNRQRILRALAIYHGTGQKKSSLEAKQKHQLLFDTLFVGLDLEREELYHRIDDRVIEMLANGLLQEATDLYQKYGPEIQAFQAIGYKEWKEYFDHCLSYDEVVRNIQKHSRNYAKRQMTYFRHQLPINWFTDIEAAYQFISKIIMNRRRKVWKESN